MDWNATDVFISDIDLLEKNVLDTIELLTSKVSVLVLTMHNKLDVKKVG